MNVTAEALRPGQTILVTGNVAFSRIASLINGDELSRRIKQARDRNAKYPMTKPHTTITVTDAELLKAGDTITNEEQFVADKFFESKSGENQGKTNFNVENKSTFLPNVFEPDPENEGSYRQLVLENDLAAGLSVTLVLTTFTSTDPETGVDYPKRGLGLQQVIVHQPVEYYVRGIDTSALAARGIVITGPVQTVSGADAPASAVVPAEHAGTQVDSESGLPMPGPGATSAQAPAPSAEPATLTRAQEIARLEAKVAATQDSGNGDSAFDSSDQPEIDPWDTGAQPQD